MIASCPEVSDRLSKIREERHKAIQEVCIQSEAVTLLEIETYESNGVKKTVIEFLVNCLEASEMPDKKEKQYNKNPEYGKFLESPKGILYIIDAFHYNDCAEVNYLSAKINKISDICLKEGLIRRYTTFMKYIELLKPEAENAFQEMKKQRELIENERLEQNRIIEEAYKVAQLEQLRLAEEEARTAEAAAKFAEEERLKQLRLAEEEAKTAEEAKRREYDEWKETETKKIVNTLQGKRNNFREIIDNGINKSVLYIVEDISIGKWQIVSLQWNGTHWITNNLFPNRSQIATELPDMWNGDYEAGLVPFLTKCPICNRKLKIKMEIGGQYPNLSSEFIGTVECDMEKHYLWSGIAMPTQLKKNTHYRRYTGELNAHPVFYRSEYWQEYDPADPDGSKAKRAAEEKEVAKLEAELAAKRIALGKS